jgi:hypothetical protein
MAYEVCPDVFKIPDRKACPCCQASALRYSKPECEQTHDPSGKLSSFALYWRCSRCGCRWMDGQELPQPCEPLSDKSLHEHLWGTQ